MSEKNVANFIRLLEDLNMKSTAEAFRKEFNSKSNDEYELGKYNIVKQLYTQLNKLSKENADKVDKPQQMKKQVQVKPDPGSEISSKQIMDGLMEKLAKRFSGNETTIGMQGLTSSINPIAKTKVFKNLLSRLDDHPGVVRGPSNPIQIDIYSDPAIRDIVHDKFYIQELEEEDLPCFGSSKKDFQLKDLDMNVNINAFRHNAPHQSIEDNLEIDNANLNQNQISTPTSNLNMKSLPNNPNNSMKNANESQANDDSIFQEDNRASPENKQGFVGNNQLDNMLKIQNIIASGDKDKDLCAGIDSSSFFQNSQSMIIQHDDSNIHATSIIDEYVDDDDPGFDLYECEMEYFKETCKKLSEQYDFPKRAFYKSKFKNNENLSKPDSIASGDKEVNNNIIQIQSKNTPNNINIKSVKAKDGVDSAHAKKASKGEKLFEIDLDSKISNSSNNAKKSLLPTDVKFMESNDPYYPVQYNNVIYDSFNLKVIVDRERTGFEESKEFKIVINSLIAGRYQVIEFLGSAAFSKAIKCLDIVENRLVCLKIIENNKDYVDQSIDEIKLLRYINVNGNSEEKSFLSLYDYFYHKEHLFIVTELLKDNLYDFYKYLNENNVENYFTLGRLQKITKEILTCLEFLHSLKLIHCDLKPENILMKSISDATVKVIDFGSSCFIHDHLSSYVQSRSYRAPEVIIGCKYDYKIDMWSLGCILSELYTGNVLFQNDSIQSLLARIIGIIGPFPDWMFEKGKLVNDYFSKEKLIFMEVNESMNNTGIDGNNANTGGNALNNLAKSHGSINLNKNKNKKMHILVPKRSHLRKRIKTGEDNFFDFIKGLLEIDPNNRMSSSQALLHPWMKDSKYS